MEVQVGELINKAKVNRCGDGDYPVLSMTMHDGLMFQNDRFKKQIASVDQSNYQVVKRHQLVESFPIDEGVLAVQELTEEGIVSPAYKIWDVNMDRVIPVYLELALRAPRSIEYYKSKLRGTTARRRSITDAEFCAMQINLPDLKEQERIIELISRARAISAKRQQELDTLDNLIKARFVEMFGDPVLNPMRWECTDVISECNCMVPGRDKPKTFTGDIPWITIEDLVVNGITVKSKSGLGLTQDEIDSVNRKAIPEGSVIMSCVGNLGICSIAGREMIINQQLHSFQCGERINNVFLMHYLGYRKGYMNKWASNTTVLYMNKTICNSIPIIVPPMDMQEQFSEFVEQVDKSKVV